MLELSYKTKGNAQPKGKPRVFFTCHPADMKRSLDRLCSDIFQAQDCAVYYTEDMTELIGDEDRALQLEQMNLFVVPVSLKLLIEPNRAMDKDVPFALDKHIPILPIILEPGLDVIYSREDKFGKLQYLDPDAHDITAISYGDKLRKYLSSVLIDDETAERVRKAFDAYIFLSYRKKDRKYANELMRLIHDDPQCRDIAIWYDEYLTHGESFSDAIQAALDKSELFTLLVTPNLVNEENYILTTEYPAAKESGKSILPVEMEVTDRAELETHFQEIPACVTPDDEQFRTRLIDSMRRIALRENDADPAHNYLIGLAYLDGIDVEVDKTRGMELITSAAEAEHPEAMKKLQRYNIYYRNYEKALKWAKSLYDFYKAKYGEGHPDTLASLRDLALSYRCRGMHKKALELNKNAYILSCRILGEEHIETLTPLVQLAAIYHDLGEYKKAADIGEKSYILGCRIFGEEHPETLVLLNDLSKDYYYLSENEKAIELLERVYALRCRVLGKIHNDTGQSLIDLLNIYKQCGKYKKWRRLIETHPDEYESQCQMALIELIFIEDQSKAIEFRKEIFALRCHFQGEEHPDTLDSLSALAVTYNSLSNHIKALELHEKVYALRKRKFGEEHPDTLTSLEDLIYTYEKLGNIKKAQELHAKLDALRAKTEP